LLAKKNCQSISVALGNSNTTRTTVNLS
jgi:hypothetical protein